MLEPTSETAALARAESTRIRIEATAFDPEAAIAAAPHALELAGSDGLEVVRLDIEISAALAHVHCGAREALAMMSASLEAAKTAGLVIQSVRSYVNLMCLAATLRDHDLVDAIAQEALEFCHEHDTPIPTWHSEVPVLRALDGLLAARRGGEDGQQRLARAWEEAEGRRGLSSRHDPLRARRGGVAAWGHTRFARAAGRASSPAARLCGSSERWRG